MPVLTVQGTSDLLGLHAASPERYPYLLQSLGTKGWDILFAFPQEVSIFTQSDNTNFFSALARSWQQSKHDQPESRTSHLPFMGGWFVYMGYELLHQVEPSVPCRAAASDFPLACIARIPAAILVDQANKETHFFSESDDKEILAKMQVDFEEHRSFFIEPSVQVETIHEEDGKSFLKSIARIKEYIHAGDVFQVNLSRGWQAQLQPGSHLGASLFSNLRNKNPAPFSGLARFGNHQIVSSSPERLVKVLGQRIETRPIAGTHPRSPSSSEDTQLRQRLLNHPKERAEHIMLLDLERNDLGRICRPGSIRVEELMGVQTYAYVHHIESNVAGELADGMTPDRILSALFPGGTITGCPKVRTMQIIRELEPVPRLAYTGSMGYLNLNGDMDLNILIRSFMLSGNKLNFRAGAGIVADSDPVRELNETRAKAKGLLKALGIDS